MHDNHPTVDQGGGEWIWTNGKGGGLDRTTKDFEAISRWIEQAASRNESSIPLNQIVILVDFVAPDMLNATPDVSVTKHKEHEWGNLLAMLILSFPEIHWRFGVIAGNPPWEVDHCLGALEKHAQRDTLFDPTGLREWVKLKSSLSMQDSQQLPKRQFKACAIDEEISFAYFHGYTAYRFGYRTDVVTSWSLMQEFFGPDQKSIEGSDGNQAKTGNHGFHLIMEDVNLYFPDRPKDKRLSRFEEDRAKNCWKLGYGVESSTFRIIVTGGHSGSRLGTMTQNREFVKFHKPRGWGFVLKPTGGMFDLWEKARLFERLTPEIQGGIGGSRAGLAPRFEWPPKVSDTVAERDVSHSAPGKLMLIASHLVRRADALREEANSVEGCIRGAVLATEALELLGYRTPTLALQALELKQWFETKAEVAFVGVGHHFHVTRRFREIERETKVASRFHQKSHRDAAALDASVTIANRLTLVFRDAGQFDEEEECLKKVRWWNRKLSFRRARNKFYLWPGLGLLAYAEWMISSLGWLVLSVAGWILLLTLGWWAWTTDARPWDAAVKGTLEAFIGSGVETDQGAGIVFLSSFCSMLGFFHLGVFVSFLYSAIARK